MSTYSDGDPKRTTSLLSRLLVALLATLFVVGCGSSRDQFVFTGTAPGPGGETGSLIYNFTVSAQSPLEVPAGIDSVRFRLFSAPGGGGTLVGTLNRAFNTTIVLTDVPTTVQSTVLTFYNSVGIPIFEATVDVTVLAGQENIVDFANSVGFVPSFDALTATPPSLTLDQGQASQLSVSAAFGNGDVVNFPTSALQAAGVSFASNAESVATVSNDGAVLGVAEGTATITASLTTNGSTRSDTVAVTVTDAVFTGELLVTPTTLLVAPGTTSAATFSAEFTPAGSTEGTDVSADTSYEVTTAPAGGDTADVTVNADGSVTAAADTVEGDYTVVASYEEDGTTFTDEVTVTVAQAGILTRIEVSPAELTIPINLFEYTLQVTGFDAFDNEVAIDPGDFTVESSDPTIVTVAGFTVTSTLIEGTATVTVTNDDDDTITGSSAITTVDATVDSIAADPSTFSLYVSEVTEISVTATLSDGAGTIVDFQNTPYLSVSSEFLGFLGGEFIALSETPGTPPTAEDVTLEVDDLVATDPDTGTDISVTVRRVQMSEVAIRVGGIAQGEPGFGSIPDGYTGVVEVFATFEDGSERVLAGNGNDYEVALTAGDTGSFDRVTPGLFQTNEAYLADGAVGDSATLTITFNEDRNGDLNPIDIPLTIVSSADPTAVGATFTNYDDDRRLIVATVSPFREIDVRMDFAGVENFRISSEDVDAIGGHADLDSTESFGHWPMIRGTSEFGPLTVTINVDGTLVDMDEDVSAVEPDFFGILPDTNPELEPGQSATFSTFVDFGGGQLNRTADYPVFENFFDFISEVYVTLDPLSESVTFFLKREPNNPPLSVRIVDLSGNTPSAVGTGVNTVQITPDP